jgi:hypothetical protein
MTDARWVDRIQAHYGTARSSSRKLVPFR